MVNPGTNSELISITTSLLTVFALAVTSKAVLISLPVIMVLDIIDSTTQGEFQTLYQTSSRAGCEV